MSNRNLDKYLSFETHIKSLTKSCFSHFRNLSKLRSVVSHSELEMLIHAFISPCIEYCNSLFFSLNKSALHRLFRLAFG